MNEILDMPEEAPRDLPDKSGLICHGVMARVSAGRPLSDDKLREKQVHPLPEKHRIEKGGFRSMRHGAATVGHSDPRITYARVLRDQ